MRASTRLLAQFDTLADDKQLRRLGAAFARFIGSLGHDSPALLLAALAVSEQEGHGHSCLRLDDLAHDPAGLLGLDAEQWQDVLAASSGLPESGSAWAQALAACPQVLCVGQPDQDQPLVLVDGRVYLRRFWRYETSVAHAILQRVSRHQPVDVDEARVWLDRLFSTDDTSASRPDWQKIACAIALRSHLTLITGGPGTGKTYTVARLLALLFALNRDPTTLRIALAAPTGKAAARLKQSIDQALGTLSAKLGDTLPLQDYTATLGAARTLHSLLGARPDTRALLHHAGNPLDVDVLIVDEASMIHLEMMAALLDALPPRCMLILLGDKDQLASVEAGAVLGDLCRDSHLAAYANASRAYIAATAGEPLSETTTPGNDLAQQTVMLRQSRRFNGPIGALALAVNAGDAASAREHLQRGSEPALHWLANPTATSLLELALNGRPGAEGGYRDYLALLQTPAAQAQPADFDAWVKTVLRSFDRLRVLCAVRDGAWGVAGLNQAIEKYLVDARLISKRSEWYVGRPVMVTRNDYGIQVFNGDVGLTLPDPKRPGAMRVYFLDGEQLRSVLASRLRDVETAFAMTVHKSQGSEFRHTVLVLPPESQAVLARELLYTGITRAQTFFTLVTPNPAVLDEAIARQTQRASGLQALLAEGLPALD